MNCKECEVDIQTTEEKKFYGAVGSNGVLCHKCKMSEWNALPPYLRQPVYKDSPVKLKIDS